MLTCLGGERAILEELLDAVLVHVDVVDAQTVEQIAAVDAVVVEQHVADHVPEVEDRAVDVEDDQEPIVRVALPKPGVVVGKATHPVASTGRLAHRSSTVPTADEWLVDYG